MDMLPQEDQFKLADGELFSQEFQISKRQDNYELSNLNKEANQ